TGGRSARARRRRPPGSPDWPDRPGPPRRPPIPRRSGKSGGGRCGLRRKDALTSVGDDSALCRAAIGRPARQNWVWIRALIIYAEGRQRGGHKMLLVSQSSQAGAGTSATPARAWLDRVAGSHIDPIVATKF